MFTQGIRAHRARRQFSGALAAAAIVGLLAASFAAAADDKRPADPARGAPDYTKHVAPLLKKYCAGCHNADDREGKLSLESFADLQKGGKRGPAILPGNAAASRLIRTLTGAAKPVMPPEDNERPTKAEVELLRRWIDSGAKGPKGREPSRDLLITPKIKAADARPSITAMDWSPDGSRIAIARFQGIEIRDAASLKVVKRLSGQPGKVNSVRFSSDSARLVSGSGIVGLQGTATLWDVRTGKPIRQFKGHRDTVYAAVLDPAMKVLATSSYDRQILLWDAASGKLLRSIRGHNGAVYDLDFSRDGKVLASASADETIKLWRVSDGYRLDTLGQPLDEQFVVRFSPNNRQVVGAGADNRIRVWKFISRKKRRINPLQFARYAHEGAIVALAFDGRGHLLSAAEDRSLKFWDTREYMQLTAFPKQSDIVSTIAVTRNAKERAEFFVGRLDGSFEKLWAPKLVRRGSGGSLKPHVAANASGKLKEIEEQEPNDDPRKPQPVTLPIRVRGTIHAGQRPGAQDADVFRFAAKAGQVFVMEIEAARKKSPLDSRIEVLDETGEPVPRVLLQAVRDSYLTFRGQNSTTSDGFRLHNWEEMELNEYLYCNGEVVKLWHYPRGPDSGFMLYPGFGARHTFFDTTPSAHPLHEPAYIVEPHPPGTEIIPNGLPVFRLYYENDDDSKRTGGDDSRLTFTAPRDGNFLVRVTDVRGQQGEKYHYQLTVRPPQPDFKVTLGGANPTVNAGSGKEFSLQVKRRDGFQGPVTVSISGLPPGFHATSPITIEAGQTRAFGVVYAKPDAAKPTPENSKATKVVATAMIQGREIRHDVNSLGQIKLGGPPKVAVRLTPVDRDEKYSFEKPLELTVAPGQTITARAIVERRGFKGRISLGRHDSGRNLAHGVYVDNIGLNGLLIVEGQNERTFFITASPVAAEGTRMFHLVANAAGNQASLPVRLHVKRPKQVAAAEE